MPSKCSALQNDSVLFLIVFFEKDFISKKSWGIEIAQYGTTPPKKGFTSA